MRDDNGSGYKSTCANEETIDETGLPRMKELAYELSAEWVRANWLGLGQIWARLGHPDLAERAACARNWLLTSWATGSSAGWSAWCWLAEGGSSSEGVMVGKEKREKKRKKGEEKKEEEKRKRKERSW